ncbi:phage portal protein [Martelella alba]|uniref:Phage portal protein n=1 Tax=Martelella alba TaxID=2590451 RepID=A0ABY2SF95_9HYPH|nr:phage portal protein [Martelella alba]TKI03569.1 phage portal protein [Martelella alba]
MFRTIQETWAKDKDMPERSWRLMVLRKVLNGQLYDNIKNDFSKEANNVGEYIPLRQRRPSVRSNLCRTVVDDSVSLLFGEDHFPVIDVRDQKSKENLTLLIKEVRLNEVMIDAATKGSVGSVAILFTVIKERVFLRVLETEYLTPIFDPDAPDTLKSVREQYKVAGSDLKKIGYSVAPDEEGADFWFRREWNSQQEAWYSPAKVSYGEPTEIDKAKTVTHNLGFVPVVWIKNLPGGNDIDGTPTMCDESIDCQIEIDYQLSQVGRGLKFMSDPTLVLKQDEAAQGGQPIVKGANNALVVPPGGDAKLLEINGGASEAVISYVKHLREIALENMHGNKASNEKIAAAQSGRAMEIMNQALIWLADRLSISYGEGAIIELIGMIFQASRKIKLKFKDGSEVGEFADSLTPVLIWPPWYTATAQDIMNTASTLVRLVDSGLLTRLTAIKALAAQFDIENAEAESKMAFAELLARNTPAQVKANINE